MVLEHIYFGMFFKIVNGAGAWWQDHMVLDHRSRPKSTNANDVKTVTTDWLRVLCAWPRHFTLICLVHLSVSGRQGWIQDM